MRRPRLHPALPTVWRDGATLQVGVDPDRAVVVGGLDGRYADLLGRLDGVLTDAELVTEGERLGLDPDDVRRLLDVLADGGALTDGAHDVPALRPLDAHERDRLAPDLAALTLVHGDEAPLVVKRRRAAAVGVRGLGRVGLLTCTLLAAAGVGRVVPSDARPLRAADLPFAGPGRDEVGRRRDVVAREVLARDAPFTRTVGLKGRRPLDVVVLTDGSAHDVPDLVRGGVPHVVAQVREATGVVGPFVVPGRSACLRCQSLHRADRDPQWPRLAAQLEARDDPVDGVLAAHVASSVTIQVLTFLDTDGRVLPPSAGATLETTLPDGGTRRRHWPLHPACGCTWFRGAEP